ncbi:hypothetical protein [Natrarchaeobaculum aegyptiacum]|nr:hypothetical protein [Natrarchaeobaculum aegyptiacum]
MLGNEPHHRRLHQFIGDDPDNNEEAPLGNALKELAVGVDSIEAVRNVR